MPAPKDPNKYEEWKQKISEGTKKAMDNFELIKRMKSNRTGKCTGNSNPSKRLEVREKIRLSKIGHQVSEESKTKISKSLLGKYPAEKNPFWKGDKIGKSGCHQWLQRTFGKPFYCEHCGTAMSRKFEWANICGHKYKRKREEYIRLCTRCHRKYDYQNKLLITKQLL